MFNGDSDDLMMQINDLLVVEDFCRVIVIKNSFFKNITVSISFRFPQKMNSAVQWEWIGDQRISDFIWIVLGSIYGDIIQLNSLSDNRRWEMKELYSQIKGINEDMHSLELLN